MYKILCLTTGSDIRWPKTVRHPTEKMIPSEVQADIVHFWDTANEGGIVYFNTLEHASWFVRRRLSYNPKRTDTTKLQFMNLLFEASDMADVHFSKKHMFEIIKC